MLKLLLNFAASWTWKIYLAIQGIVWSSDVASSGICKQFLLTYWEVVEALISLYEWDVFKYPSLEVIFETCIGYNTWIISSLYSFLCLEVAFCFALFFLIKPIFLLQDTVLSKEGMWYITYVYFPLHPSHFWGICYLGLIRRWTKFVQFRCYTPEYIFKRYA